MDDVSADKMPIIGYRFELIQKSQYERKGGWETAVRKDFPIDKRRKYLFTHLKNDTLYLVRVASKNLAGLSEWTESKEFNTLSYQPKRDTISEPNGINCLLPSAILMTITSLFIKLN